MEYILLVKLKPLSNSIKNVYKRVRAQYEFQVRVIGIRTNVFR